MEGFEPSLCGLEPHCSPRSTSLQVPRPGLEPGTPRSKRGMIFRFTIGASSRGRTRTGTSSRTSGSEPDASTKIPPLGQISAYGFRSHLSGLKDRRPRQKSNAPSVCRAGVEPAQLLRVGYSHLGSPMPSRHMVAWVGVEPTNDHQALDLAALPVCVPRREWLRRELNPQHPLV
jgi:hypothetical protein